MATIETAQKALVDIFPIIRRCITYGFEQWQRFGQVDGGLRAPLTSRTRANFVYDHIIASVRREFADRSDVKILERRGFPRLVVRRNYEIRFKKLDKNGRSKNILTRQQRLWFEGQDWLPGMDPTASRIVAGYVLDLLGAEIENVLVVCPRGVSDIEWTIVLPADGTDKVIDLPRQSRVPKPPVVRSARKAVAKSEHDQ